MPLGDESNDTVPDELLDVVLAIVRDRPVGPVARISTSRTVDLLYGPDGVALAEFCDDDVVARAAGRRGVRAAVARMGVGAGRGCRSRPAGPAVEPAAGCGRGRRPATVRSSRGSSSGEDADGPDAVEPPADPVHRAVAEQVEQLLVWDRAVRADVYDSVHQMRVTTRKIRSLLQASEGAFGISDDAWILDELRQLAAVLGVARDAEVLAERYERALDELPEELARGPVRERLVDGAKKHYKSGLRRSLIAMRSQRYFRLLDALEGLVAAEPPPTAAG